MVIDEDQDEESIQHKLEILSLKFKESEETIRKLNKTIQKLEEKLDKNNEQSKDGNEN